MSSPTFIATYSTSYSNTTITGTMTVTTKPGDLLVIFGAMENNTANLGTPSGNGIAFTLQTSVGAVSGNYAPIYIWSGVDTAGGTNWTLTTSASSTGNSWGTTCYVFRNAAVGTSAINSVSSVYSMSITPTKANSAIITYISDWSAQADTQDIRVWQTVNGYTPSAGNGLEKDYQYVNGGYTVYGAYYPDAGATGTKTVGLSTGPGTPVHIALASIEVVGVLPAFPWLRFD